MKYILTTGCSFTNNLRLDPDNINQDDENRRSWPYYLQQELGDEYQVLNYGGATNDNVSMCRIQLYHIDRLIKEGINPKDILIITQWSDAVRSATYIDRQFKKSEHHIGHTLVYHPNWKTKKGVFFLTGGFSPPDQEDSAIKLFGIENAIKYWELDINWDNQINQVLHWLELWNLLEIKCKELGIKTYYMSMRNSYSIECEKWGGSPENNSDIPTKTLWFHNYEVLKPYLDILPIDSPNHWHYKNYCGLLEWSIDNKNDKEYPLFQEYVGDNIDNYEDYLKFQPYGWGHPSPQMMEKFVKEELKPFLDEKLYNK
jgi:hypothetical protein